MDENILQVPSGRFFSDLDLTICFEMVTDGFIRRSDQPFRLKSGIMSHVYVFGREDLTDNPKLEWLIGRKIALLVQAHALSDQQICLIGIPTAGTPLAQAAAIVSYKEGILINGQPICHRLMREVLKQYGAHQSWVNGNPSTNHQYWDVDNVITDGASKFIAKSRMRLCGYPVDTMPTLILVDRQQGGVQRLKEEGFTDIIVAYNLLDLTYAFGELGIWPKKMVKAVEKEIKEHQL